jgi:hypothetical protein
MGISAFGIFRLLGFFRQCPLLPQSAAVGPHTRSTIDINPQQKEHHG